MQLCFLGVTSAIKNHRNSNMFNSQSGVGIRISGQTKNRRKLPQNIVQFVICHLHNIWPWKSAPCPCLFTLHQKRPLYFKHATQKFCSLKAIYIFSFVRKFASAWKSISHCKLFEVVWFYIVLCLRIKVVKGTPLAHFLLYFKKHMTCSRACGSRVVHQLLNKTMQKLSAKVSKRVPRHLWKKGAPRRQPCSPSAISTPALNYIQKKELASFYDTIELFKILCNVIKIFFDHSVMLRII